MKIIETNYPKIKGVEFINSSIMFMYLDNDRTFIVPLNKFKDIEKLTPEQRREYEIIDDNYLSFLAIDEIYSLHDLLGI